MSDFDIFNDALMEMEKVKDPFNLEKNEIKTETHNICSHESTVNENNNIICLTCGSVIECSIEYNDKEWNWYPDKANNSSNRVIKRKPDVKTIFKDLEYLDIPDDIITEANRIYFQVVNQKICRGNIRKALIYACILKSYEKFNKHYSYENLMNKLNISKKHCLKGIKMIKMYAPKDSKNEPIYQYIKPSHLLDDIMSKLDATLSQKTQVSNLYGKIEQTKSNIIKRARPKSTACAIVFFWILKNEYPITIKEFSKKVGISELTITKLLIHIKKILHNI